MNQSFCFPLFPGFMLRAGNMSLDNAVFRLHRLVAGIAIQLPAETDICSPLNSRTRSCALTRGVEVDFPPATRARLSSSGSFPERTNDLFHAVLAPGAAGS